MKIIIALTFLVLPLSLKAEDPQTTQLKTLISATEQSLEDQKTLLTLISRYQNARAAFSADMDNQKLAALLVKRARHVDEKITQAHLEHLFDEQFLTEVRFFKKVGTQ